MGVRESGSFVSKARPLLALLGLPIVLTTCGGGGGGGPPPDPGTLKIFVDKVQFADLRGMHLEVARLEILHTPDLIRDAEVIILSILPWRLSLVGFPGITPEFAKEFGGIPAGYIVQFRFILADGSTVTIGFDEHPVKVPSGTQTGEKIISAGTEVPIEDRKATSVTVRLDPEKSVIRNRGQGIILKPVLKVLFGEVSSVPRNEAVEGQAVVGFALDVDPTERDELFDEVGAIIVDKDPLGEVYLLEFSSLTVEEALNILRDEAHADIVKLAIHNLILRAAGVVPDDTFFDNQWALHNHGDNGTVEDADIDAPEAWSVTQGNPATVIAVLDSGAQLDHPDLLGNIWTNPNEIPGNGIDEDDGGAGYIDDVNGWNFIADDANVDDDDGHGTRVAGVIGAKGDNGSHIAGVTWNVQLMVLKVLDSELGWCTAMNYEKALRYARRKGAVVANQSLEGIFDAVLLDEYRAAYDMGNTDGPDPLILNVIAAGNKSINLDRDTENDTFPAEVHRDSALVVTSTNSSDLKDVGSANFGGTTVHVGAPGVLIQTIDVLDGIAIVDGTSYAAAFATGVVALSLDAGTSIAGDPSSMKTKILNSVDVKSYVGISTGGRLNAAKAVTPNAPPVVDAGPDLAVTMPDAAALDAAVSDDGLPSPPAQVTVTWTKDSGPGPVTIADEAAVDTMATFYTPGTYVLRLTTSDSEKSASDTVTITVTGTPQPRVSFEGISAIGRVAPPDTHGAAGPSNLVLVTNHGMGLYSKTGTLLKQSGIYYSPYFFGERTYDPKVIYDMDSERFIIVAMHGESYSSSRLHIAVSKTSAPSNLSTDWHFMVTDSGTRFQSLNTFFHYPGLGVNQEAVYVTGYMQYKYLPDPIGVKIRAFRKADLLAGTASKQDFDRAISGWDDMIQSCYHYDVTPGNVAYLVRRMSRTSFRIYAVSDPFGAGNVDTYDLTVADNGEKATIGAPQPGTGYTLDVLSTRMMHAVWRNGSIFCVNTSYDSAKDHTVVRWYEIATNGFPSGTPAVVQYGDIDESTGQWAFVPSINVDSRGNVAICYSLSSSSRYAEVRYTARAFDDPPGTMRQPVVVKQSSVRYRWDYARTKQRWGDYSATVVDPADDSFWICNEWIKTSLYSGTWWANFSF